MLHLHAQYQDPEIKTATWNSALIHFVLHSGAIPPLSSWHCKKKKKKDLLAECFGTRVNEVEKIKRSWKFVLCLVNSNFNKKSPAQGRRPCPGGFNSKEMSHVRYRIEAWRLKRQISVTTEQAPSIHWWILCGAAEKPPEEVAGGLWVGIVGDLIPVSKEPLTN